MSKLFLNKTKETTPGMQLTNKNGDLKGLGNPFLLVNPLLDKTFTNKTPTDNERSDLTCG